MSFNITTDTGIYSGLAKKYAITLVNSQDFDSAWRPILAEGNDILHLSVSSSIGEGFKNAREAAKLLKKEFPGRKIVVFDTLSVSLGELLQVINAAKLKESGKTLTETIKALLEKRNKQVQLFSANPRHLKKPIFKGNYCGEIVIDKKTTGFGNALKSIVDDFKKNFDKKSNDPIGIAYEGDPRAAKKLMSMLKKAAPNCEFLLTAFEPGSCHFGRQTLALFYTCL